MANENTTFGNLKINALRRAGNNYNSNDTTRLSIAGSILNEVAGIIQSEIKGHPFTLDIGNTVSTTANQAYVDLAAVTDILEILQVYERTTNRKIPQITYEQYISLIPDPTRFGGISDMAWAATQVVTSGKPNWFIYLIPTPSSTQTLYYDYMKSFQMSADADYCPLPTAYDGWWYSEFKPIFYEVIDSKNRTLIRAAKEEARQDRAYYKQQIMSQAGRYEKIASRRGDFDYRRNLVSPTPTP